MFSAGDEGDALISGSAARHTSEGVTAAAVTEASLDTNNANSCRYLLTLGYLALPRDTSVIFSFEFLVPVVSR